MGDGREVRRRGPVTGLHVAEGGYWVALHSISWEKPYGWLHRRSRGLGCRVTESVVHACYSPRDANDGNQSQAGTKRMSRPFADILALLVTDLAANSPLSIDL